MSGNRFKGKWGHDVYNRILIWLLFFWKKTGKKSNAGGDDDANESEHSIKLSNNRYLTVSEFKNKVRVDIREYYMNDAGERKPGKKGISLSLDEWKKVVSNLDTIKQSIKKLSGESDEEEEEQGDTEE